MLHRSYIGFRTKVYTLFYKLKYGAAAPHPQDIIRLPPGVIQSTFPSSLRKGTRFEEFPRFGVLGGDWDTYLGAIEESVITQGLEQRFLHDLDWTETTYYRTIVDNLEKDQYVSVMAGYDQSKQGFEAHLDAIDSVYEDLKENGFKSVDDLGLSDLPTVHIARDGECILHHGHHRTVLSRILGLEEIPYSIAVRHKKWQEHRVQVQKHGLDYVDDVASRYGEPHPDVASLLEH